MNDNSVATYSLESALDRNYFISLASLREAHSDLLKLHRKRGNQQEVLANIEQLIYKGRATGAILDGEDDRWSAQSILEYRLNNLGIVQEIEFARTQGIL
jgi:hypothetical protein